MELFQERGLPFDRDAARRYAELAVTLRWRGLGFPIQDGYAAAIAAPRQFIVASRDMSPFDASGLQLIDPWRA